MNRHGRYLAFCVPLRKVLGIRRTVLLMVSMALTLLLAGGVALAINEIRCRGGECKGARHADKMLGSYEADRHEGEE